MSSQFSRE